MHVLAADIGGTGTRLAVFSVAGGGDLRRECAMRYASRDYASFGDILEQFISDNDVPVGHACFGVAGPVINGRCEATNLPWVLDAAELSQRFDIPDVALINDLEANAWGIPALDPSQRVTLAPGQRQDGGNAALVSAGTGLGQAGLYWDGERHRPFACEGGHSDFAPSSAREVAFLQWMQLSYKHVSWDRIVSGSGLVNLFDFLVQEREAGVPDWLQEQMRNGDRAAAISTAAMAGRDPLCREALDWFVELYAAEAGNFALKVMATGGVYIGGGIAPKILECMQQPVFLERFCAKGRMETLMRAMPIEVILDDQTALNGAAIFASEMTRS